MLLGCFYRLSCTASTLCAAPHFSTPQPMATSLPLHVQHVFVGDPQMCGCRSLIGIKRKAGFKATDKKGVVATAGQALRAAVEAISQFSLTASHGFASTIRGFTTTLRGASNNGSMQSNDAISVFCSTGSDENASSTTSTGRWQVWRGSSHAGASPTHSAHASTAASTGSAGLVGFSPAATTAGTVTTVESVTASRVGSRLRNVAAASSPLQPSSAANSSVQQQQTRSGAGLPLGEGREEEEEASSVSSEQTFHTGASGSSAQSFHTAVSQGKSASSAAGSPPSTTTAASLPAQPPSAAAATASAAPATAVPCSLQEINSTALDLGSSLTSAGAPDSSRASGCCDCSWLRANLSSLNWRFDPWVILLLLCISVAALAGGAVQLAVRARSRAQVDAIKEVGCYRAADLVCYSAVPLLVPSVGQNSIWLPGCLIQRRCPPLPSAFC